MQIVQIFVDKLIVKNNLILLHNFTKLFSFKLYALKKQNMLFLSLI